MNKEQNSFFVKVLLIVTISLLLELIVFNFRYWWGDDYYTTNIIPISECTVSTDYEVINDYCINLNNDINQVIEIYVPVNGICKNVSLYVSAIDDGYNIVDELGNFVKSFDSNTTKLCIYSKKDDNWDIEYLGNIYCNNKNEIFNIDAGQINNLCFQMESISAKNIIWGYVQLNVRTPFKFSIIRFLVVSFILFLGILFSTKYMKDEVNKKVIIISTAFFCVAIIFLAVSNIYFNGGNVSLNAYNVLAESIINGHVSVFPEYSHSLDALDDPYDYVERINKGIYYVLDYAYYDGQYYVYFGIVPCLLFYVPFKLLFHTDAPNTYVNVFILCAWIIGYTYLLYQIMTRYFEKFSNRKFVIFQTFIFFVSMFPYIIAEPTVYLMAQISALMFSCWGIALYVKAGYKEEHENRYLLIGSFLLALAIGCRPTVAFIPFLSYPLLYKKMLKKDKAVIKKWIYWCTPYVLVGLLLCLYNYVRFDNIFEFGSRYNLTSAYVYDIPVVSSDYIDAAKFMLFYKNEITNTFPFFNGYKCREVFHNFRPVWKSMGGFLVINILCWVSLVPQIGRKENKFEIHFLQYYLVVYSAFIVIFDVIKGNFNIRYMIDGAFWWGIATLLVIMFYLEKKEIKALKAIKILVFIGILISIINNSLLYFDSELIPFINVNHKAFYAILRNVMFWL